MELKTIGLTKKFGSKTAVDNLNITLTNGVYPWAGSSRRPMSSLGQLFSQINLKKAQKK